MTSALSVCLTLPVYISLSLSVFLCLSLSGSFSRVYHFLLSPFITQLQQRQQHLHQHPMDFLLLWSPLYLASYAPKDRQVRHTDTATEAWRQEDIIRRTTEKLRQNKSEEQRKPLNPSSRDGAANAFEIALTGTVRIKMHVYR